MNRPAADLLVHIRRQASHGEVRITQHAQQEMVEDGYTLDHVLEAIESSAVLEYYPDHRRGACCLLGGQTISGRPVHVVCTTDRDVLILITVYEP